MICKHHKVKADYAKNGERNAESETYICPDCDRTVECTGILANKVRCYRVYYAQAGCGDWVKHLQTDGSFKSAVDKRPEIVLEI